MRRKIVSAVVAATIAAVGFGFSHSATPVKAASCNTNWTYYNNNNNSTDTWSWTTLQYYNANDALAYQGQSDGNGGCYIRYAERFTTDHTSDYYVAIRIWLCGSPFNSGYDDLLSQTDTGWIIGGWIDYGTCGPQADTDDNNGHSSTWAPLDGGLGQQNFTYLHF